MSEVVRLVPAEVGADYRFDPDQALENMKGKPITSLLIIAELEDGSIELESDGSAGVALILMERAKHQIVFGDDA